MISLKKFSEMRVALLKEKQQIEARLQEINAVLGAAEVASAAPATGVAGLPPGRKRKGWKRLKNPITLKDAVIKVTSKNPMTKDEIAVAVQKLGYKFASSNPINRLGVLLYGKNPKFKNDNGKFSPA